MSKVISPLEPQQAATPAHVSRDWNDDRVIKAACQDALKILLGHEGTTNFIATPQGPRVEVNPAEAKGVFRQRYGMGPESDEYFSLAQKALKGGQKEISFLAAQMFKPGSAEEKTFHLMQSSGTSTNDQIGFLSGDITKGLEVLNGTVAEGTRLMGGDFARGRVDEWMDVRDSLLENALPARQKNLSEAISEVGFHAAKRSGRQEEKDGFLIVASSHLRGMNKRPQLALEQLNRYLAEAKGEEAVGLSLAASALHKKVKNDLGSQ